MDTLINSYSGKSVYIGNYPKQLLRAPGLVGRNFYSFYEKKKIKEIQPNVDKVIADASVDPVVSGSLKDDRDVIEETVKQNVEQHPTQEVSENIVPPKKRKVPDVNPSEDIIEPKTPKVDLIKGGSSSSKGFKVIYTPV